MDVEMVARARSRTLMWVKGHSRVPGNEVADRMAERTVDRQQNTKARDSDTGQY